MPIDLGALTRAKRLPFERAEYDRRLAKVRAAMAARGIDLLLVSEPESMYYLTGYFTTGYWSVQTLAVPASGEPFFVVRHLERTAVLGTSWVEAHHVYQDTEEPAAVIAAALAGRGVAGVRIGVETHCWFLTVALYERLKTLLSHATFVDAAYLVNEIRYVKSDAEIAYIRQATAAAEAAVQAGIAAAEVGRTEAELAVEIFRTLVRLGSDRPDLGVIASGERVLLSHGRFTQRRLEAGDPVRFEPTGRIAKYNGRFMRTVHLGKPPAEVERTSAVVAEALEAAIETMRPGVVASEVDAAARARLARDGLSISHRSGYSMGVLFVPTPTEWRRDLLPDAAWTLEAGMVFHMILLAPSGVGHSEMVLVTERGREVLTRMDRRLFVK